MLFVKLTPDAPMADIVAVPCHVPANAAGIVTPVACVAGVVCVAGVACVLAIAGLMCPASELLCVPTGGPEGDLWVSSTMPRTARAATAVPETVTISPRRARDRAGPGLESRVGSCPEIVGSASGGSGPWPGIESGGGARAKGRAPLRRRGG